VSVYVALLRAVNVSGTGKLPMVELKAMADACGFGSARTFIASGNLVFTSDRSEPEIGAMLEEKLQAYFGRRVPVFVRTAAEMAEAAAGNPFGDDKPSRVMVHFIAEEPDQAMIDAATNVEGERMALGPRAIYVSYGAGIGKTRLKLPAVKDGTARNMNTVAKLAALAEEMS
jgi:uncharacterized protein (DUF1697 family)